MYDTLVLVLESGGKPTSQCLASAVFADDLGLIELLVEHGADVNKFYLGRSPLMAAAYDERTHVMRLLLEMGASVEDESHYLSVYHRSHTETSIEVLRILLEGGTIGTRLQVGGCMAEVVWNSRFQYGGPMILRVMEMLHGYGARMPLNFRAESQMFVTNGY